MATTTSLDLRPVSRLFRALGDETRLRIVALLAHGELCVCHLQNALALTQPNVSRQLAILRAAGIVDVRRQGSWVHYRLREQEDPECEGHLQAIVAMFAKRDALRRDVKRLRSSSGPQACR